MGRGSEGAVSGLEWELSSLPSLAESCSKYWESPGTGYFRKEMTRLHHTMECGAVMNDLEVYIISTNQDADK